MAGFAKVGRTLRCLRELPASDGRFFILPKDATHGSRSNAHLHCTPASQPFFVISFLRYGVMGILIRQGNSVL
jgi:hypothetical protein